VTRGPHQAATLAACVCMLCALCSSVGGIICNASDSASGLQDPSCGSYSQALLYYKGFHAIQTHRIGHCLWHRGQKVMALMLQSRISEVFAVDIHPAARIGYGVLLDHGTGVVIGETAVIGNNCSLLQVPARSIAFTPALLCPGWHGPTP
jgi:hypothetical protein